MVKRLLIGLAGMALILVLFSRVVAPASVDTPRVARPDVIRAAVLPHHDLVASQRQAVLADLAKQIKAPATVVIVSPDHFGATRGLPQTTDRTWDVAAGKVEADGPVIGSLASDGAVLLSDVGFSREHGVANLIPDVRAVWPEIKVVPIMIDPSSSDEKVTALVTSLTARCPDCLLIASVDMSHYQPAALADLHDIMTARALRLASETQIRQAEVDCPVCLVIATRWAQSGHFVVKEHTNSGRLADNPEAETTTHLMGWFESGPAPAEPPTRTMLLGGDIMLGRDIAQRYQTNSFKDLWTDLGERTFWGVDIPLVNFEAPISAELTVPYLPPNVLRFIAPGSGPRWLASEHISYAGLANNHTATWGQKILEQTTQALTAADVTPVGRPNELKVTELPGGEGRLPVALLAVNLVDGAQPGIPELITKEKAAGFAVVVLPHWGVEYQTTHNQTQHQLAAAWVAAGADLIVGGHPHVVQDAELIDGVPVIYSLGNLVFDQYFSTETQRGLLLGVELTTDSIQLTFLPTELRQGRPRLLRGDERVRRLEPLITALSPGSASADGRFGVVLIKRTNKTP